MTRRGLTLLEVVLAIALTISLVGAVLWFYDVAGEGRSAVLKHADIAVSQRTIMDRITDELRAARASRFLGMGVQGGADSMSMLTTCIPGPAVWIQPDLTDAPPPPESDVQRVGYRLRTMTDDQGLVQIVGLERTVNKLPSARQSEESTPDVTATLLTGHFKFLQFRYYDGANWAGSWSGLSLPKAVEITLGVQPLPEGMNVQDYPYEVFRRMVYVPGGVQAQAARQAPAGEPAAPSAAPGEGEEVQP